MLRSITYYNGENSSPITTIRKDISIGGGSDWQRVLISGEVPTTASMVSFKFRSNGTFDGYFAKPMLSKGTIASIWKPHTDELISDGAITTDKLGDNAVDSNKLNLEELFVSEGAFINELKAVKINTSQLEVDTIRNDLINLEGTIKFDSFNEEVNKVLFVKPPNSGQTWINGGMIATDSIKADSIDLLSGLTVSKDGNTTFAIDNTGSVKLKGDVESFNYSNVEGKEAGYKLDPNGTAHFNDAILRGSVILANAGATNYGNVSNNNLMPLSDLQERNSTLTRKGLTVTCKSSQAYGGWCLLNLREKTKLNTEYTLRFKVRKVEGTFLNFGVYNDTQFTTISSTIDGKPINFIDPPEMRELNDGNVHTIEYRFKRVTDAEGTGHRDDTVNRIIPQPNRHITPSVTIEISEVILAEGNSVDTWNAHANDVGDLVRFWAGTSYDNRDQAPFVVYQNGKVKATEGEFGGTFTGELSIGNILIKDTNTTSAEFSIKTNNNANEVVKLTDTHARFDVDTNIGDVLGVSVGNKQVTFGDSVSLDLKRGKNTVALNKDYGTYFSPIEVATDTGSKHEFKIQDGYSGINFQANGVKTSAGSETAYDYKFSRGDGSSVSVVVEGGLVVKDKITMHDNNKIELVSISGANSGIDFMIR